MGNLANNFNVRTLILQVIFVAIIAVSIAGVARQSLLLEWSALIATLLLLVVDPLTSGDKVGATPTAEAVKDSAIKGTIFNLHNTAQATPGSGTLIASKV